MPNNPWRVAKSLLVLRDQINALSPNRAKISDGTIGDAAHASRSSDHNPWVKDGKTGIVTGMDLTHDPAHGIDSYKMADVLRSADKPHLRDPRLKYIISNGRIASDVQDWAWRKYTGKNKHDHHVHISVKPDKSLYDNDNSWDLEGFSVTKTQAEKPVQRPKNPLLVRGNKGADVERLQKLLNAHGASLTEDADFGERTEKAVIAFQKKHKLVADGQVGPQTWGALL